MTKRLPRPTLEAYERGVLENDRALFAKAITLIESRDEKDGEMAQELLSRLLPSTGKAMRVGITGIPGVGKSTFIDELGMRLLARGHKVAVLAVDPSSTVTGGSILGDKTRMGRLSLEQAAFIRPSPSGASPGGIARRTRESMLICEAAGYDVVLVETVGVGQSETAVSEMVDFFLVLSLAGSGDELQGIKKGVLELADAIVVNKVDGENAVRAKSALTDLKAALRYLPRRRPEWPTEAFAVSGLTGEGLDALWALIEKRHQGMTASGELQRLRAAQQRTWMETLVGESLMRAFRANPAVAALWKTLEQEVVAGTTTAPSAAARALDAFLPRAQGVANLPS